MIWNDAFSSFETIIKFKITQKNDQSEANKRGDIRKFVLNGKKRGTDCCIVYMNFCMESFFWKKRGSIDESKLHTFHWCR